MVCGIGGSGSTVLRIELRLLLLKKLGGDFMEKPDLVLPCALRLPFSPRCPSFGAVRGLSIGSSRYRGTLGASAASDCLLAASDGLLDSLFALER